VQAQLNKRGTIEYQSVTFTWRHGHIRRRTDRAFLQQLSSGWDGRPCQSKVGRNVRWGSSVSLSVPSGAGSPSNTMWPGPRPTSISSGTLRHPTV